MSDRPIHADFLVHLQRKDPALIHLFLDARQFLLSIHPGANELLYQTHALTAVYSLTERLSEAYCMLPIYTNHFSFGFNQGTRLSDPNKLLKGTGSLIRHIAVSAPTDYRNKEVEDLVRSAILLAKSDLDKPSKAVGLTISKIKEKN